jgi:hypothetical protein
MEPLVWNQNIYVNICCLVKWIDKHWKMAAVCRRSKECVKRIIQQGIIRRYFQTKTELLLKPSRK